MKILFVTDGVYPFVLGGMQKHAGYVIRNLADTQHEVDVIITGTDLDAGEAARKFWDGRQPENIRFHVVPYPVMPCFPGHYLAASYLYARRLTKYFSLKISTPDIIYAKGYTMWHYLSNRVWPEVPVISQLHGLEMYQEAYSFREEAEKLAMRIPASAIIRGSDYLFSYGGKVRDILLNLGKPASAIFEQYGAADDFWLFPPPSTRPNGQVRKFLFVARYEYRKGYHLLKEALQMLVADNETFEIDVVGNIPQREYVKDDRIRYHQNRTAEEIREIAAACEVLLVPSLSEGFPTIIIETMARGISVAASDVGAVRHVVNERNGWLLKPGSVTSLYSTMKEIIRTDQYKLADKQDRSRELILEEFQWKSSVNQLVSHLETAVHDYRARITGTKHQV